MQRSKSVVRKKMQRSKSIVGRRAWNILRLALLWARKGGVFLDLKKRLFHQHFLDHFHSTSHIINGNFGNKGNGALQYGDRQLSFDATPMIHVKMHRPNSMRFRLPHIPCINPHSNDHMFDFDDDVDYDDYYQPRKSFLIGNGQQHEEDQEEEENYQPRKSFFIGNGQQEDEEQIEDEIDVKAEQFIANFYEQLKLQRQFYQTRRTSIEG